MNMQYPVALSGAKSSTLMWAQEHEVGAQALQQLRNIAALPWVHGVAVMPDVHFGKGATVGLGDRDAAGRVAGRGRRGHRLRDGAVCDLADRRRPAGRPVGDPLRRIEAAVPVGFGARRPGRASRARAGAARLGHLLGLRSRVCTTGCRSRESKAQQQMGIARWRQPLHRGLPATTTDRVWLMLHSGFAQHRQGAGRAAHADRPKALPHNADLPDRDLAVFLSGTPEMDAYRRDLTWAQEYALAQPRGDARPGDAGGAGVVRRTSSRSRSRSRATTTTWRRRRSTTLELLVTRKGAIRAGRGDLGLIPGSMGTGSYVVRGLGLGAVVLLGLARGRPADEPQRGQAALHGRRPGRPDRRRRVPQGRGRGRRDARRRTRTSSR